MLRAPLPMAATVWVHPPYRPEEGPPWQRGGVRETQSGCPVRSGRSGLFRFPEFHKSVQGHSRS